MSRIIDFVSMCINSDGTLEFESYLSLVVEPGFTLDCLVKSAVLDFDDIHIDAKADRPKIWRLIRPFSPSNLEEIGRNLPKTFRDLAGSASRRDPQQEIDGFDEVKYIITFASVTNDLESPPTKRQRLGDQEEAARVMLGLQKPVDQLPTANELKEYLERPLREEEKVPIPASHMNMLISNDVNDLCLMEHVQQVFRVWEGEPTMLFDNFIAAVNAVPPVDGTESSWHGFWDKNFRDILQVLVPDSFSIRDSNNTRRLRPDFALILKFLGVFRGEEKAPGSDDDPKSELSEKLEWAFFERLPYLFGYYATGPNTTLVALTRPALGGKSAIVIDLATVNLRKRAHRIRNISYLLRLSRTLEPIADLAPDAPREYLKLMREGKTVELLARNIVKTYTGNDKHERFLHTKFIYRCLKDKLIPHVDSVLHFDDKDNALVLSPRGHGRKPKNRQELIDAVCCVLEALQVSHQAPTLLHRDIRWPNIVKCWGSEEWILIDWEDGSTLPTTAKPNLSPDHRHHGVYSDGHDYEVDVWGVGDLIESAGIALSSDLESLFKEMKGSNPPTASKALSTIREIRDKRR